jgi:hypothetical protein
LEAVSHLEPGLIDHGGSADDILDNDNAFLATMMIAAVLIALILALAAYFLQTR